MENDSSKLFGSDTRRTDESGTNEGIQTKGKMRSKKAKKCQGMMRGSEEMHVMIYEQ